MRDGGAPAPRPIRSGRSNAPDIVAHMQITTLTWPGARNAADLGGLPLVDGGATAHGRVWRAAAPEWMTDEGWQAARDTGLALVVDLRNQAERGRRPEHPDLTESGATPVPVVATPTEDPDDPGFLEECGAWLDHPRSWEPNLRRYPDKLADVFRAVADAPGPVLVHCAGGRDRTGMVCSMLLSLTGVEPEAIAASYEHGFRGAGQHRGHGLAYDPGTGGWAEAIEEAWTSDELDVAMADRLPVLHAWLAETDVRSYLLDAGLDQARVERLRTLLRT